MPDVDPNAQANLDKVAPGGIIQLDNAPASLDSNTDFDNLFPAEPTPVHAATTQQPNQQTTQPQSQNPPVQTQPPATQTPDALPFLKGDRSVYKTPEAAVEGINQKDALIDTLRQRYVLATGIDPISGQPIGQVAQQQVSNDYFENPDLYMKDLLEAAKSGNPQAYRDVQAKFIRDSQKPLQPLIANAARSQAVEAVSKEIPTIGEFVKSPAYTATMDANPELKEAIALSESDSRFQSRLPGLYKLAYLAGTGMQVPALLKAQQTVQQTTQAPQQTQQTVVRTTQAPTTQAPPTTVAKPNLRTLDGLRAIISDAEARGIKLEF